MKVAKCHLPIQSRAMSSKVHMGRVRRRRSGANRCNRLRNRVAKPMPSAYHIRKRSGRVRLGALPNRHTAEFLQPGVESPVSAVKCREVMIALEFLDEKLSARFKAHERRLATWGPEKSFLRRGFSRGGRSKAALKRFHCSSLK